MAQYVVPSTAPIKTLKEVQFGILSPVEIETMSVGEIVTAELGRRAMEDGGLMDLRQGPSDERTPCKTCDARASECPGHFAHIKLERPVFHPGFTSIVISVLRSVCISCGKVLGHRGRPDFMNALDSKIFRNPKARLRAVSDACRRIPICETVLEHVGCNSRQPTYKLDGSKLTATFPPEKKSDKKSDKGDEDTTAPRQAPTQQTGPRSYSAQQVYNLLKRISDEDCYVLGLDPVHSRPEWMIVSVIPVAPPCVRPSTSLTGAARGHDDLTVFYSNIVKANICLKEAVQTGDHVMDELTRLLQHYVSAMIDNNRPGQPTQSNKGRPLKALAGRIESKEGRVRNNLMGKRCDFSARTVITPDPNISIDQVGVPSSVARNLTFPEMVTNYNMQKLQELVKQGPNNYPGAKYIIRANGHRLDLRFQRSGQAEIPLEVGDIVERHIVDGDVVIFNRQPSLHKMSMMGHRIKVFPYSTFRLNLSVTTPYNADFDGDEMNLHVPQSHETRAEIQELMMVPKNIISPQGNKPCMGIVQDTLLGCSLFTRRDTFLEKDLMMNTLMWLDGFNLDQIPIPAILKPKQLWTGKQIFSLFIPNEINLKSHSNDHDTSDRGSSPRDTIVYVSKGRLLLGILDKRTLGSSANGGLIHVITNELKSEASRLFFDSTQKVVNYWLLQHSFSVGLGDTIVSRQVQGLISEVLNRASQAVHAIVKAAQKPPEDKTKSTTAGRSPIQVFEQQVNGELNRAISEAGKRVQKSLHRNNFKTMVSAGSKGSDLNISQIMACVGQQNVDGQRIPFGFSQRTLPHFTKDDYGQESRGFVSNSYRQGLTPQEFYFHAMGGRVGLIDTAVKTSETGYIQRRLVKALEDVRIHYDGTVRNAQGQIIQFIYGEDGIDACKLELEYLESLTISNNEFMSKFKWDLMNKGFGGFLDQSVLDAVRKSTIIQTKLQKEFEVLEGDRRRLRTEISPEAEKAVRVPVHLIRLIWNAQNIYKIDISKPSTMNPEHVVDQVQALCDDLHIGGAGTERTHATDLFRIHVRATLASLRVLRDFMLTLEAFNWVIGEIRTRFRASIVQPGESVGAIAAQSIGEPATQMTLNTFHLAGVATDLTVGVPRLKELINVAKQLRTPSATVRLDPTKHFDKDFANKMISNLEYTTLRKLTKLTQIWYDPCFDEENRYRGEDNPQEGTVIEEDQQWLSDFMQIELERAIYSPWVLRLVLDGGTVQKKGLSMTTIAEYIKKQMPGEIEEDGQQKSLLFVAHSQDNEVDQNGQMFLVIHVRIIMDAKDQETESVINDEMFGTLEEHLLDKVELCGDHKLRAIFYHADQDHVITKNDGTMTKPDQKPWVLGTDGVNLQHILSTDGVDPTKTTCNDINEVLDVLGIEAARGALFQEIRNVIRFAGSEVNYRHLALLADVMTFRGVLAPITRFGINRSDNSPLARCSFEETVDILFEAAQFAETDPLKAVSGRIMLGQMGCFGTGSFDLIVDEAALEKVIEAPVHDWFTAKSAYEMQMTPMNTPFSAINTPYNSPGPHTPWNGAASPNAMFTPTHDYPNSPSYSLVSPSAYASSAYNNSSPRYGIGSPGAYSSPVSPLHAYTSPGSRGSPSFSPASPGFSPTSPGFSPSSPAFSPASPAFSPASPAFSPASPAFSPASPAFSPASPAFSPSSPSYSPRRPGSYGGPSPRPYSPTSPAPYSPSSPAASSYSPTSPASSAYSPTSPRSYSPTSPAPYSPTSPRSYSPTSPAPYSPTSAAPYSPTSPRN